jgi:hypothetical protein
MTTPAETARRERYAVAIHDAMEADLSLNDQEPAYQALIARAAEAAVAVADAEITELRALAADATEYRVHIPTSGGTTLIARRRNPANGTGWAVSIPAHGGGRAWTTEGWQHSISALSVDRLFCWPDAATAITEARQALTTA